MTRATPDVLVVDDEPTVCATIGAYLEREGFTVRIAGDGTAAIAEIGRKLPDLLVLDLMLPEVDGLEVLKRLRAQGVRVPVIVVSARGSESERVAGLELGADDYVAKPASPREIAARARAVLRRTATAETAGEIGSGAFRVDMRRRLAWYEGEPLDLAPRELDLLAFFLSNPGVAFSRAELLHHVWGSTPEWQDARTVTVHVRRLRQAIEPDSGNPAHLLTVYGTGYRFEP